MVLDSCLSQSICNILTPRSNAILGQKPLDYAKTAEIWRRGEWSADFKVEMRTKTWLLNMHSRLQWYTFQT